LYVWLKIWQFNLRQLILIETYMIEHVDI
jgi:hypothetical protein